MPTRLLVGCLLFLTGVCAHAAPVVYCVQGVTFSDGGTLSGCFIYDATTNTYSGVNLLTTTAAARTGASYGIVCGQSNPTCNGLPPTSAQALYLTTSGNAAGSPGLALVFATALGGGGTVPIAFGQEATCNNAACSAPVAPFRLVTGVAAAVVAQTNFSKVRYASNLAVGDSFIDLTNTGALSTVAFPTQNGNICANVYVFSPDEQLISCCTCPITPNGLVSLSARNDLISNTLTPGVPTSVVIKIVSSSGPCNASTVGTGANNIAPGLAAWGTTIHALPVTPATPATTYGTTETPFTDASLSGAELARVTGLCAFIQTNGSTFGICRSCRLGGLGGGKE